MSKRRSFSGFLQRSGALAKLLELRARTDAPWLSILTYHRFPKRDGSELFDDGVIDTTVDEFEDHVKNIKRHFTIVGIEELRAFAAGGALPPNAVAITFDDGYRDAYQHALPILLENQCRAIFFLPTSFISERRLYWWDAAAYLMKQSTRSEVRLTYPRAFSVELRDRELAIFKLLRFVKTCRSIDLERLVAELSVATGVAWNRELEHAYADGLLMTWDDARALRAAGMDVQSHTRTHRILQTLRREELKNELEGSRRDLERELGEAPTALAYPVGMPVEQSSPIRAALADAGYEMAFSNGTGPTPTWGRRDRYNIRRQTVARNLSTSFLLSILAVPPLAPKHPWHRSELA